VVPGGCFALQGLAVGPASILFHARRNFGGIGGGLQGCADVLLELWAENTLGRNLSGICLQKIKGDLGMAYVIAEPCIGTKDSACVDACPVDCIHPKKDEAGFAESDQLFIDPVECIDCGACVPVCPVSAIYAADDLPEKWADYQAKNAAHFGR
jgi:NAD-dependent dihydropyrimidine dehydrogenase PreA subunit